MIVFLEESLWQGSPGGPPPLYRSNPVLGDARPSWPPVSMSLKSCPVLPCCDDFAAVIQDDRPRLCANIPVSMPPLTRGLGESGEVTGGPCDHVAVAVDIAIALVGGSQDACDIARHGRFFG